MRRPVARLRESQTGHVGSFRNGNTIGLCPGTGKAPAIEERQDRLPPSLAAIEAGPPECLAINIKRIMGRRIAAERTIGDPVSAQCGVKNDSRVGALNGQTGENLQFKIIREIQPAGHASPSPRGDGELVKKWGQAPRVGVILPVVRIGRRSQSPFFHKLGGRSCGNVPQLEPACQDQKPAVRLPASWGSLAGQVCLAARSIAGWQAISTVIVKAG